MSDLPTIITTAGLQQQSPQSLLAQLLASVEAIVPGYTARLPGILIEDISSTDVGAAILCDQARVEDLNSLDPRGANDFLLLQQGQMLGVQQGVGSNTSVFVVFSGTPGFVIGKGFTVSDGTFQYIIQDGGAVGSGGDSPQLFAVSPTLGTWPVPADTVSQLVTPPPTGFSLAVTNPQPGTPGNGSETATSYRARVQQANLAASQGMSRYLKTLLGNVDGVQPRLIAAQAQEGGGWKIVVGGGDPIEVAYAIYQALFNISTLKPSTFFVTDITSALPAIMATALWPAYTLHETIVIAGASPVGFNGTYAVEPIAGDPTHFKLTKPFLANVFSGASFSTGHVTATTTTPHGITVGSTFVSSGNTPSGYNGTFVATAGTTASTLIWASSDPGSNSVLGQVNAGFSYFDASSLSAYVADSGIVSPDDRNITATIIDYPDTYPITYVNPPQQTVAMTVTWNTSSVNFVAPAAVEQLGAPALVDYVNSVGVGQPMNLFQLQDAFKFAIVSVLPPELLTRMVFAVSIDGFGIDPESGTGIIAGDAESFFFTQLSDINVVQG